MIGPGSMRPRRDGETHVPWLWALLAPLIFSLAAVVHGAPDLPAVPPLSTRVLDLTSTLNAEQLARLETRLRQFEENKGSQIAVLLVPSTQPEAIEQYSIRVAEQWKLGRKKVDDGAILIVAKNDRALRIEVGYGLEGSLTDAVAKRIIADIIAPRFKNGDFHGGIEAGVDAMIGVIEGEALPPSGRSAPGGGFGAIEQLLPVVVIAALLLGAMLRSVFGRVPGALLTGGVIGLVAWFFAGFILIALGAGLFGFVLTLMGGRMGMGILHGGLGGGRRGGGGFSGGGGGFGGGGASGRW